jgi:hypothetical protein
MELMQEQHKAMLRNLINGVYEGMDSGSAAHAAEAGLPVAPMAAQGGAFARAPAQSSQPPPSSPPSQVDQTARTVPSMPAFNLPAPEPARAAEPAAPAQAARPASAAPAKAPASPTPQPIPLQPVARPQPIPLKPVARPQPQAAAPSPTAPALASAPGKFPLPAPAQARTAPAMPAAAQPKGVPNDQAVRTPAPPSSFASWRPPSQTKIHHPPPAEEVPVPPRPPTGAVTIRPREGAAGAAARNLPPEVLAARRLTEKPVPNTSGPTIFGEDLISEKSLDEVILSYLSGDGEEKR